MIMSPGIGVGATAQVGQKILTDGSFGSGPTVIQFDRFSTGVHGNDVELDEADIGGWTGYHNYVTGFDGTAPTYYSFNGRLWITGRQIASVSTDATLGCGLMVELGQEISEFFWAMRGVCPTGYKWPGAATSNNGNMGSTATLKATWFGRKEDGYGSGASTNEPDFIIPNFSGSDWWNAFGNQVSARYFDDDAESGNLPEFTTTGVSGTAEQLWGYYQGAESVLNAADATLETLFCNGSSVDRRIKTQYQPFRPANASVTPSTYNSILFPGWMGNNQNTWADTLPLFADAYLAVGSNSRARIMTGDASTLSACTNIYIIPPDSWSDSEIRFTPESYENLEYTHVVKSDGTLLEDVG